MERLTFTWAVNLLFKASCVQGDFVEPLEPVTFLHSLIGSQTRLPCHYKEEEGEQVLQVIWQEEHTDGNNEQVIRAHFTDGITVFVRYIGRVKFESSNPTANSALLIPITEVSDEGTYICSIELYPRGTFVRRVTLKVWNPVSPVHLKVDLVFNTSTFCNLTVTCSTDHSFFGSSFTCGSKSCKQDDGQQTEHGEDWTLLPSERFFSSVGHHIRISTAVLSAFVFYDLKKKN
ncbi:hypothetical protein OJAV_G00168100 [Oryzias javanicus]|uniref:Ig-like domain-containing protein n=1 Tax=Oryzias javanicus TaxID=123683 RepID=A0A437CEC7_ORYJA|nr:hypothetical protein OJAV_G00168100 [Oryzias javanicus]